LYEELRVLQTGFQQVSKSNHEATEKLTVSSGNMQSAASKLSSLGTSISEAADSLSTMVDRATNSTNELSQRNIAAVEQLKTVLNQYQQFAGEVRQTSENLRLATEHAESGFASVDQHLQQFQQSMEKQVNDMQEQMQNLMVHFAEQVKTQTVERIQVWTDETSKYTSEMTRAISTIADVVDDIEGKVGTVQ
jgi:chromosome segregation ATPase